MGAVADAGLVVTLTVATAVAYGAARNRPRRGSYTLAAFMGAIAVWTLTHLLAHAAAGLDLASAALAFERLQWLGIAPLGFLWLAFALSYVGRRDLLTRRGVALLLAFPAAVNVLAWTVPAAWSQLEAETGVLFWGYVVLSWGLIVVGAGLLVRHAVGSSRPFRSQVLAVVVAVATLLSASVVAVLEPFGRLHVHVMPVGTATAGVALLWAVYGGRLTDLAPVSGAAVLEGIAAGVLVVDDRGRVTHATDRARQLVAVPADEPVVGEPLADVLAGGTRPRLDAAALLAADGGTTVTHQVGDRFVDVHVTETGREAPVERVLLVQDVTDRERRKRELQRQNERLEEFAGVVSHDLRNPLGVAQGYLETGREAVEDDPEAFDRVADALDRMDAIVADVLALAKQGETVEAPEPVRLSTTAREAWSNVVTGDATLVVEDDAVVEADRSRLQELLENCFSNAVDHGDADTVRVTATGAGFRVDDDGRGLPDDVDVFESGATTSADGTGFGLSIVETICRAHGWTVTAGESDDGGARLEVDGVASSAGEGPWR